MVESNKTNRRLTAFITFIVAGIFLLGAGLIPLLANAQQKALDSAAPILPPATTNYPAPQLALSNLKDNPVSIGDHHGKVILINNWSIWSPPCETEMPEL
jgi:thiol-disulfide isomerase/thioredoxin